MGKTDKLLRQHPLLGVVMLAIIVMEIVKINNFNLDFG